MSFDPLDEMLSFWHVWQKLKKGNEERREERLEIEEDPAEEIKREK